VSTTITETGVSTKTRDERKELLATAVANEIRQGWRVESQSDYQAVIVKGNRPNHLLHLLLTLFTLGLWGIVWIAIVALGGEKRGFFRIDECGRTNILR
jgi:hypothetical protein